MPTEIVTTTNWISAIAAALACLATFILAIIAWKQASISDRQRQILGEQAEIFRRQAGYQGQQTTISQRQAAIMERQTNISDQQLAIIKEQETDRKNAAMRADLVIASRAEGENVLDLIIENKGSGWAREIKIFIDGYPIGEYPPEVCRLLPESAAQTEIGPGNKLNYLLEFPGVPAPTNLRIDLSWISDNGIRSTNLGFVIPRQELDAYKQGHQRRESIAENGPRMDAYTKFMELMSVRPIDLHYARFKIVPQLETIQLYSSPEVKRIAREIHDWTITEMKKSGNIPHLPVSYTHLRA
ncbi:MAG: hypothetical protein QUS09_09070, partial [Methanotrichaceae archaeon]|nr:hypothetical protein [Methanotrichaceae archaeon]